MADNVLNELLEILYRKFGQTIGEDFVEMILYGSFARGNFDNESDLDLAVIVNRDRKRLKEYQRMLISAISEMSLQYDILISVNYIPLSEFEEYKEILTYYRNIDREGVRVVA